MSDPGVFEYTIQADDTLWDLADQYDMTVEDIMDANPDLDPYNLMIGQIIALPTMELAQPRRDDRGRDNRRRDSRRPDYRRPYRRPYRPYRPYYPYPRPYARACPPGTTPYSVRPGESLYSIGSRFGISVDAIIAANPYVNFGIPLQIGQVICLPV